MAEKHKHTFSDEKTEKVILQNKDGVPTAYDLITYKECECGYRTTIKTERHLL